MAIDWDGKLVRLIDMGAESYEDRVKKLMFLGAILVLSIIAVWRFSE